MNETELLALKTQWNILLEKLNDQFDTDLDLQGVLFLIGVQELGKGYRDFSKEEKQDLMHIGTCKVLCYEGYYEFIETDADGWPHFKLIHQIEPLSLKEQDLMLRKNVIRYFAEQ